VAQQKVDIHIEEADGYRILKRAGDLDVYTVGSVRDVLG
jgi:hypothetical protein